MASFMRFCFATLFILVITSSAPATTAEEFKVGGDEGWRQPNANETEMYSRWAATKKFHIGDSLRFKYKNDTVQVVDKGGYYHCNSSHPISVFHDGNTVIKLQQPGLVYFVSADPDHCKNGQRVTVEVMPLHQNSQSPSQSSDASLAPSLFSGARSFLVVQELVFFYVAASASFNM
ncbi:UNVERIFIED_CONTAM: Umecyanin [Sesamum radiatum]|uniref:Umecyanin n=1 Tax=Sesamum radiatum TaxID=300843 RepID=A0AAW2WL64_SESRA